MKLMQRTILITGGSSGIGLELARQLLQRDNTVIITGRDQSRLEAARAMLPALHILLSDVGEAADIVTLHRQVLERFPSLDVVINNAGIMRKLDLNRDRDLDDINREIVTNLSGPVRMVQQFLGHLKTRPAALIVNVTSGLAYVPMANAPVYSATKAALYAYTRSLRAQLAGTCVRVVELAPPLTETPLLTADFKQVMKGQTGMEVTVLVSQALRAIEGGRLEIRPGQSSLLKLLSRIAPDFIFSQLAKYSWR